MICAPRPQNHIVMAWARAPRRPRFVLSAPPRRARAPAGPPGTTEPTMLRLAVGMAVAGVAVLGATAEAITYE
eukprot:COSAG02_NODE_1063_length_14846_cov_134.162745_2_plen_73_part_00